MAFANVRERQLSPAAQYGAIANRGQAGGINSVSSKAKKDAFVNTQRGKFFDGRKVPEERVFRRTAQDTGVRQFKDRFTKPVEGSSNLLQMTSDAPRSLAAERERLANVYGPTLSEIGGDMRYGLGNIAKSFAEKGPPIMQLFKGIGEKFKSGVEKLWDNVRGENPSQTATEFPQPGLDTRDLFSSINTGIASDPNNLLVQIAKENANKFVNNQTFEEQLENATAQNLNLPSITDIVETTNDAINAARAGTNINTPFGSVNVNPLNETLSLGNAIGNNINYGGTVNRDGDYNVGINAALPGNFRLSAGTSSNDLPGVSLSNSYKSIIPGVGNFVPSVNMSGEGDLNLGLNTTVDPLRMMGINSAIPFDIGVGANINDKGQFIPNINFNLPFSSNAGLGFMLK